MVSTGMYIRIYHVLNVYIQLSICGWLDGVDYLGPALWYNVCLPPSTPIQYILSISGCSSDSGCHQNTPESIPLILVS
jgi:hypothetical protein